MKSSTFVKVSGEMKFTLERPEPSLRLNWVESAPTESMRKRRSTSIPSDQEPALPNCLPSSLSSISAYQFWEVLRMGKTQSLSGRDLSSARGGAVRALAYLTESVVDRVVPRMLIPASFNIRRNARAVKRFGSGIAKYSVPPLLSEATLPWAQSVIEPGTRKKSMVSSLPEAPV